MENTLQFANPGKKIKPATMMHVKQIFDKINELNERLSALEAKKPEDKPAPEAAKKKAPAKKASKKKEDKE
jgi:hypothetical protein